MLLLLKNCLVFWKRQPWVSSADVTLLVGVHKYLLNFWFKSLEDCYIRVSQIVKKKWGPSDFCLKRVERNLLGKSLPLGCAAFYYVFIADAMFNCFEVDLLINIDLLGHKMHRKL